MSKNIEFISANDLPVTETEEVDVLCIDNGELKRRAGASLGGASSWNDLEDKPFDVNVEKILMYDRKPDDEYGTYYADKVPLNLVQGELYTFAIDGVEYTGQCYWDDVDGEAVYLEDVDGNRIGNIYRDGSVYLDSNTLDVSIKHTIEFVDIVYHTLEANYIESRVPRVETKAYVGQVLRVKEVDEHGVPTKWEATCSTYAGEPIQINAKGDGSSTKLNVSSESRHGARLVDLKANRVFFGVYSSSSSGVGSGVTVRLNGNSKLTYTSTAAANSRVSIFVDCYFTGAFVLMNVYESVNSGTPTKKAEICYDYGARNCERVEVYLANSAAIPSSVSISGYLH